MKPTPPNEKVELRRRAEAQRLSQKPTANHQSSDPVLLRALHELQVHQVELEMQNEELRTIRDELEVSKSRYSELYNFAPTGYLTLDRRGRITQSNLTAASMLSTERDQLTNQTFATYLVESDRPLLDECLGLLFDGKPIQNCTVGMESATAPNRTVQINANLSADGLEGLLVMEDVSALHQTTEALKESEARWQFAINGSGDGAWDWDVDKGTVFFSKLLKEMLGYSDDEIGHELEEWSGRIHPEDRPSVMADLQAHLDGQTAAYTNEHRLRCKNGSYLWILDRGLVVSLSLIHI